MRNYQTQNVGSPQDTQHPPQFGSEPNLPRAFAWLVEAPHPANRLKPNTSNVLVCPNYSFNQLVFSLFKY